MKPTLALLLGYLAFDAIGGLAVWHYVTMPAIHKLLEVLGR